MERGTNPEPGETLKGVHEGEAGSVPLGLRPRSTPPASPSWRMAASGLRSTAPAASVPMDKGGT